MFIQGGSDSHREIFTFMVMVMDVALGKNTKSKWPKYKVKYKKYPTYSTT
jgi:hypothetical protein